jgi:hypothetical protein
MPAGPARGGCRARRANVCAAGPDPHDSASSRLRPAPRPDARPAEQAERLGPAADALPYLTLCLTGVSGLTVDIVRVGLALWPRVDDRRCHRRGRADHARRAAARPDGGSRGHTGRSDGDGAARAASHHARHEELTNVIGSKPVRAQPARRRPPARLCRIVTSASGMQYIEVSDANRAV